jgi:hypothetical protein
MPKKEVPLAYLSRYLPEGTESTVLRYLTEFRVHLTVTRDRRTVLGDYRHRTGFANHRISVNGGLNPYAFLVTLLHELAHLLTFEQYGNRVSAHGREWKAIYANLLGSFLKAHTLPADIERELKLSLRNPAAGSCAEDGLMRVLRQYDRDKEKKPLIEELAIGVRFRTADGRVFVKGEKLRKRFKCLEVPGGREYLFSPIYEVAAVLP